MSTIMNYISCTFIVSLISILNPIYTTTITSDTKKEVVLVENSKLQVSIESESDLLFFKRAIYDDLQEELVFSTDEETVQIRVYDDLGSMIYLLPVQSKKIKMGKSLFNSGQYRIVFDVDGDRRRFTSKLIVY
jgi:hypothetical protein